jgi:hypothetical protein
MAYAIGGMALAHHAISAFGADPEFVRQLEMLWPGIRKSSQVPVGNFRWLVIMRL